jgi:hypothetical protein
MRHSIQHDCCPHCGQLLPFKIACPVPMSGYKRMLFQLVAKAGEHGISVERLTDRLYADRPDGGPTYPARSVCSLLCQMNRELEPHGMQIRYNYDTGGHVLYHDVRSKALSAAEVREIREHLRTGVPQRELARRFDRTLSTITNINTGRTHKDVR